MADLSGIFKRPQFGIITALLVVGLLVILVLPNRSRLESWFPGSENDTELKQQALALHAEVSELMNRFAAVEHEIRMALIDVESKMNRLEGLLRSPRSMDEKTEIGSNLRDEESRWENLREQAALFDRWGTRSPALASVRDQLAEAAQAFQEGHYRDPVQSLAEAKDSMSGLLQLHGKIEKMQQARQEYRTAKQELDILATTHRVTELPGSSDLNVLIEDANSSVEHGAFEESVSNFQSAVHRVTEMKREVLATAIERAKQVTAEAIKAGNPVRAREALNQVKALSEAQQRLGPKEP